MKRLLTKLMTNFQTSNKAGNARRKPSRTNLRFEGLEDRMVLSAASPVEFQPMFVIAPYPESSRTAENPGTDLAAAYSPVQIRTAYSINNSPATGAGQTIAIVDAFNDPNIFSDLDVFDKQFATTSSGSTLYQQYGQASSFLTVYNQNGNVINPAGNTGIPVDPTGKWELEEAMDVEWAHAIAPGASIDLVETNSANSGVISGGDLYTGVATAALLPGVSAVSMSWGTGEWGSTLGIGGETDDDGYFSSSGVFHPGVTFLAAAGDSSAVQYPAASPNVVAVGGTTLTLNANFTIQSETAWSTGSDSKYPAQGTGGGTSTVESEPSYQEGFQSTGKRTTPDVSFDADPNTGVWVYDSFGGTDGLTGGWGQVGGTSLATPCWAGLIAMANQQRNAIDLPTLNSTGQSHQTQTLLYGLSSAGFNDITSGSITANGHTYQAGPGYDEVTGLGSPIANVVVDRLSDTLHLTGDQNAGFPDDEFTITTTASGGFQVTNTDGEIESFAPGTFSVVYLNAGAGINTINVNALPSGVELYLDNNTPGHIDNVTIAPLSNIAGTVIVANSGGATALSLNGTADDTGRTYTVDSYQIHVSGMPGTVYYYTGNYGDVDSLAITGGSGNNTMNVYDTAVPVSINAGSGTNNVSLSYTSAAVNITGNGTNYVTIGSGGSLANIAGPVNISNTSNATGGNGTSYVTIDDTNDPTGQSYTISSSSIAVQGGPTISFDSNVAGVTINDAIGKANSYTVESVLASDPLTINGDLLDVLSGPAEGQVTLNKYAHS